MEEDIGIKNDGIEMTGRPIEVRKIISEMKPEDAYILGMHIGGLLEIGYHHHGNDIRGILPDILAEKLDKWVSKDR